MSPVLLAIIRLQEAQIAAEQLRRRIAGQSLETAIGVNHRVLRILRIDQRNSFGRTLDQAPIQICVKAAHDCPSVNTKGGGGVDKLAIFAAVSCQCRLLRKSAGASPRAAHPHQPRLRGWRAGIRPPSGPRTRFYGMSIVANGQDVASCGEGQLCALDYIAKSGGARHGQVVREYAAVEPQLAAQDAGDPAPRQAGRQGIDGREDHVGAP